MQGSLDGFNVDLSWAPVPGATGYEIWAVSSKGAKLPRPFVTSTGPSAVAPLDPSYGTVTLDLHPVIGGEACTAVAASLVAPPEPVWAGAMTNQGVSIAWSVNGDYDPPVDVLRGLDQHNLQVIATVSTASYLDRTGEVGTVYWYSVRRRRGSFTAAATARQFQTPIAAATNLPRRPATAAFSWDSMLRRAALARSAAPRLRRTRTSGRLRAGCRVRP